MKFDIELLPGVQILLNPSECFVTVEKNTETDFEVSVTLIENFDRNGLKGMVTLSTKVALPLSDKSAFTGFDQYDPVKVNEIMGRFGIKLRQ